MGRCRVAHRGLEQAKHLAFDMSTDVAVCQKIISKKSEHDIMTAICAESVFRLRRVPFGVVRDCVDRLGIMFE